VAVAHPYTNRLVHETSPYLLQHAHNPVDWHGWNADALASARRLDRPIFLSVGYSTCYWCHVMERQCFEVESIARVMNEKFINIKVDREERPDVDQLYMTAVQILTRQGGWPMSVFLTPDLKPFYGGTYFPPADAHGRIGFPRLLEALDDAWKNRRGEVEASASQLEEMLHRHATPPRSARPSRIDAGFINNLIERSVADYDPQFGGFGGAPKFPRQTLLELLLAFLASAKTDSDETIHPDSQQGPIEKMLRHTLDALAAGGIRDHLGGGFHRYSTDAQWLVPHFEIMLYDNAMLGWIFAEASQRFSQPSYEAVARGIFDFILRDMTSAGGAFFTAFDAEVDAQEGLTYLWTREQVEALLSPDDSRLFCRVYGLDSGSNFADPHHGTGRPDKNVLCLPASIESAATQLKIDPEELVRRLVPIRQTLLTVRNKRKQPMLDTKILTSWNALMIRALAHAGDKLNEPRYVAAAVSAAEFVLASHASPDGGLFRTSRDGQAKYDAFLDDYAFLIDACLTLHRVGAGEAFADHAARLTRVMQTRFEDPVAGGFFFTSAGASDILVRQKSATDSPLPSGNAIAARALIQQGEIERAGRILDTFSVQLDQNGEGMGSLVTACLDYLRVAPPRSIAPAATKEPALPSPHAQAADVVEIAGVWADDRSLRVELAIANGHHIQANPTARGLIATSVTVRDLEASVSYPVGIPQTFPFADSPANVYSGHVTILVTFAKPVTDAPVVALTYQACTDQACLPPITKHLQFKRS